MSDPTIIDRMYEEHQQLLAYLQDQGEHSLESSVQESFPKVLLLAAASYFEDRMKQALRDVLLEQASEPLVNFFKNKAIERQYHTYFNWRDNNANQFFGLFGPGFKKFMSEEVQANEQLAEAIRAFLEVGYTRNTLVHENFAIFPIQKTVEEVYRKYQQAMVFVRVFPKKLQEYVNRASEESP